MTTHKKDTQPKMSFMEYLFNELTRGYVLENDDERYTTKREKMYTFMKIPRELEKFMSYGFFHCLDSFLFLFTFLPIRFVLALASLVVKTPLYTLGIIRPQHGRLLYPAEVIDLLKGLIIAGCAYVLSHIDTSMIYHLVKSQSVIKLYVFYSMLEVGDRLFSAFGQDTIDALFWTATEPRGRKREHIGVIPHFLLALTYVIMHTLLVLLQATALNVSINASNKALLTIMMSNNFVELKISVFKKFDKNNLFQVSCSDVRERFHLFGLLFIVVVQTMKEYGWKEESFWTLVPDCLVVLGAEFLVDWLKHAFITRFNEVSAEVYKDYTTFLAYDLAQTKQKNAFSDHSDIVSRRMGFIPLPLAVVMIRVIGTAVKANTKGAIVIFISAYLCLVTFRILASIVILGKACDLIDNHQQSKAKASEDVATADNNITKEDEEEDDDMKLLESKLEVIESTSKVSMPPPSTVMADKEETSLTPIEEDVGAAQIPVDDLNHSPESSISRAKKILLWRQQTDSWSSSSEVEVTGKDGHRWNNSRRHQILLNAKNQGDLSKSAAYSDSRRRPLSCTPPSVSLSTSISIDDDEHASSAGAQIWPARVVPKDEMGSRCDTNGDPEGGENDVKSDQARLSVEMRPKSLSSPDFMTSYSRPYDAERDWPQADIDSDDDDDVDQRHQNVDENVDILTSNSRRGSSEDESRPRRRKRFDTDRL